MLKGLIATPAFLRKQKSNSNKENGKREVSRQNEEEISSSAVLIVLLKSE